MSEFTVFRVSEGIGNACAFRFSDGSLGIVDWGTQEQAPLDRLNLEKGTRVRFVMASHAHADHTLGLPKLLATCIERGVQVDKLVFPSSLMSSRNKDYLGQARVIARSNGIEMFGVGISPIRPLDSNAPTPLILEEDEEAGWRIVILAPPTDLVANDEVSAVVAERSTGNVTSIVALYETTSAEKGCGDVLLPGDAEIRTLEFARNLAAQDGRVSMDCDLLLVPHHGSHRNFPDWLHSHVLGSVAVSATHNSPHHPAERTLIAATRICGGNNDTGQVFCTSYAKCCRERFAGGSKFANASVCFGNIRFEVKRTGTTLALASNDGDSMRPYGHCGQ